MSESSSEWVCYSPPKSASFGQGARVRNPREALRLTEEFLDQMTTFEWWDPPQLSCLHPSEGVDAAISDARIAEAVALFGKPTRYQGDPPRTSRWEMALAQQPATIAFALDDDRFPKQKFGPTELHFACQFHWRRFPVELAKADSRASDSTLRLFLGGRSFFIQPYMVIPLAWDSAAFREFLREIEPTLPFKLNDRNFKRYLAPKSKKSEGRFLKMPPGWRDSWRTH